MASLMERMEYGLGQSARVAWFASQYLAIRGLSGPDTPPGEAPFKASRGIPGQEDLTRGLRALFERDWDNIDRGLYAKPHDLRPDFAGWIAGSRRMFADLPDAERRRLNRENSEVFSEETKGKYPRYYLQNFHYQTDGWLTEKSAKLYDTQVEVLFTGTADAMRRQALVPLAEALRGRDQREMRLLDVACGTGRLLTFVKDNYPRLPVTALDLSQAYLDEAARNLRAWTGTDFVPSNAETMPFEDGAFPLITNVYLFHELPPKIRRVVAKEIARVLAPGGTFVMVDSLQFGDTPGWDGLLEHFPARFHEPYYMSYLEEDFPAMFTEAGLIHRSSTPAFLSKVMVFEKPD